MNVFFLLFQWEWKNKQFRNTLFVLTFILIDWLSDMEFILFSVKAFPAKPQNCLRILFWSWLPWNIAPGFMSKSLWIEWCTFVKCFEMTPLGPIGGVILPLLQYSRPGELQLFQLITNLFSCFFILNFAHIYPITCTTYILIVSSLGLK